MQKLLSLLWLIYYFFIALMLGLSALSRPGLGLNIAGFDLQGFVTISGSMEPFIMTGDMVLVGPVATPPVLDQVITFKNPEGVTVTHRIIKVTGDPGQPTYTTKGDNNNAPDPYSTGLSSVVGVWKFTIPKAGYFVVNAGKPLGLTLILLTPVLLYLIGELSKTGEKSDKKKPPVSQPKIEIESL